MARFLQKLAQDQYVGVLVVPAKDFFVGERKGEEMYGPDTERFLQRPWGSYEWDKEEGDAYVHVRVLPGQEKEMLAEVQSLGIPFEQAPPIQQS